MKGPVTACADCALYPSPFRLTDRLRLPEAQALSQRERVTITRSAVTTSLPRALISKPFPAPRPATHGAASDSVIMLAFFDIVAAASALQSSPVHGGGGPPQAVEGANHSRRPVRPSPCTNLRPKRAVVAPSTMLRMVPLPRSAGEDRSAQRGLHQLHCFFQIAVQWPKLYVP